jgi:hypothetical protein
MPLNLIARKMRKDRLLFLLRNGRGRTMAYFGSLHRLKSFAMLFRRTQSLNVLLEAKCTFLESMICQEQLYGAPRRPPRATQTTHNTHTHSIGQSLKSNHEGLLLFVVLLLHHRL